MTGSRRTWNEWDVPYFGAAGAAGAARRPHAPEPEPLPQLIRFFDAGARVADRIWAVLLALGAIACGAALTGALLVASFVLSWLSTPSRGEVAFAVAMGAAVAVIGVTVAVLSYIRAGRPSGVRVFSDRLEITYPSFDRQLVVPRDQVRAAAIDTGKVLLHEGRFRIAGTLPDAAFADALDNMPALPWDDLDPERKRSIPGVILETPNPPRGRSYGYEHDDPDQPGWGSSGTKPPPWALARDAFLWSPHGSSLPFLRMHPSERPNLAIVFHGSVRAPRTAWWFGISPINGRRLAFRGGRPVHGFLLTIRDITLAHDAFDRWGISREITADDVLDEGLLVAKPLTGYRALVYALIVLAGIGLEVLFRALR